MRVLAALFLLFGTPALASTSASSTVVSPFELEMHRGELYQMIARTLPVTGMQGHLAVPMPDMAFTNPVTVALSGMQLAIDYDLATPALDPTTLQWSLQAKKLSAQLVIQKIDANQVIHEQVGNIQMDITLKGSCTNVTLSLPEGAATASGKGVLDFTNGAAKLSLTAFSSAWTPGGWHIDSLNCQGPQGFDTLVRQNLVAQLQTIDPFLPGIRSQVQDGINQQLQQPFGLPAGATLMVPDSYDVMARARDASQDLVKVAGKLVFSFPKTESDCSVTIPAATTPVSSNGGESALVLPLDTVSALLKCAQASQSLQFPFDGTQVPGFTKLMHSRMKQLLAWPDLLSFDEDAVFKFVAHTDAAPVLSEIQSEGPHKIGLKLAFTSLVDMSAPVEEGYVPYMHLSTPISGPAHLVVEQGKATILLDHSTPFHLKMDWDEAYTSRGIKNKFVMRGKVEGAAHKFLVSPGIEIPLPAVSLADGTQLSVQDADVQGDKLSLHLAVTQPKANSSK